MEDKLQHQDDRKEQSSLPVEARRKTEKVGGGPSPPPGYKWHKFFLFFLFIGLYIFNVLYNIIMERSLLRDYLYLTHWYLTFQVFFSFIEFLANIVPEFSRRTESFRGKCLYSIALPYAMFVSLIFWSLVSYDENLVRDPPESRSPDWYNQMVHTAILPIAFAQCLLDRHKLPSPFDSVLISISSGFLYLFWTSIFGITFNMWPYKLLCNISITLFLPVIVAWVVVLTICQQVGIWTHKFYWKEGEYMR